MTVKYAFMKSLPIMAGYLVLGMGFGMLLESRGFGVLYALGMSVLIYAGSMQYVAVDLLSSGASLVAAGIMTLMVNARHLFYGISMIQKYKGMGKSKVYLMFSLTDETYSLVCSDSLPKELNRKQFYCLVSLFNQCYWVIGSVIGSIIGSVFAFNTMGIEFSMTALFLVVLIDQWRNGGNHKSTVIGVSVSIVCLLLFGPGNFIIPSMIGITLLLTLLQKYVGKEVTRG